MNVSIANLLAGANPTAWRQRIVTAAASGTPVNLTTVSVSALAQSVGVATATTSAAHGFEVGDTVTISGATPAAYNGSFKIESVPSATTFTYRVDGVIANVASGTIVAVADLWYRAARFIGIRAARTANTGIVYLGLSPTNDTQPVAIAASAVVTMDAVTGARLNLRDLWLDVATNGDGVLIWWH